MVLLMRYSRSRLRVLNLEVLPYGGVFLVTMLFALSVYGQ